MEHEFTKITAAILVFLTCLALAQHCCKDFKCLPDPTGCPVP
jgi:hypothetical protein